MLRQHLAEAGIDDRGVGGRALVGNIGMRACTGSSFLLWAIGKIGSIWQVGE